MQATAAAPHGTDEVDDLPGTRRLFDAEGHTLPNGNASLKRSGDIVLVPQPTDSPNDPLQWSLARKIWHTGLVCFVTAMTAATSNDAGSASDGFNADLGIGYAYFNTGAGVLFAGIGYWTLLSSPAVHLYGRRILYLVNMLLGFIGNIWFGFARNAADTIWSQLFVGASESVAEATVQLSLMDLWFDHQAGAAIGIYVLATSIGTYMGSLVASYISYSYLGYRWVGYMGAVFSAGMFLVLYFGLEETQFDRARYLTSHGLHVGGPVVAGGHEKDRMSEKQQQSQSRSQSQSQSQANRSSNGSDNAGTATPPLTTSDLERRGGLLLAAGRERPKSYWQRIRLVTPAPNLRGTGFRQYLRRLVHTLRVFTFPAVWYAGLQWGAQNAWLTFYLTVEQDTWTGAPWHYTDAEVGNMNVPTLIGAVAGCFIAGWGSDAFLIWRTRRRGGVMEAEQRLWLMLPCAAVFPAGMFLFGVGSGRGWSWPVPYVGLGFIGFGYGCAGDLSMAYLVDAYPGMVLEGMVGVAVINNTVGCVFSFVASAWIDAAGVEDTFWAAGCLAFAALATSVPMMMFGKRARRWTCVRYRRFVTDRDGLLEE